MMIIHAGTVDGLTVKDNAMSFPEEKVYLKYYYKKRENMNVVKQVIKAVWPVIYNVLAKGAEKTETEFDDMAVKAINTFILEFVNSSNDGEQNFY